MHSRVSRQTEARGQGPKGPCPLAFWALRALPPPPPRRPGYRCPQKDTMNPQGKGGRGTDSRYFFFGSRVKRVSKGNISSRPNSISKVRTSLDRTEKDP